ncbi:MAG: hypothetical protein M0Z52_08725 [Actinomycetota bacterium]|nr:hypothetical protein [Actinomycetota bacterium]
MEYSIKPRELKRRLDQTYRMFSGQVRVLPSHAASIREQDGNGVVETTMSEARGDICQKQEKQRKELEIGKNLCGMARKS